MFAMRFRIYALLGDCLAYLATACYSHAERHA